MKRPDRSGGIHPVPRKLALTIATALAASAPAFAGALVGASPGALLANAPIIFERNDGQYRPDVLFVARGMAGEIAIRYGEVTVTPRVPLKRDGRKIEPAHVNSRPLRVSLSGLNPEMQVEPRDKKSTIGHHYQGSDPATRWENIPYYGAVVMRNAYRSIDLAVHGGQGALEYDFVVQPGADPAAIRLDVQADSVSLDASGNLVMSIGGDTLQQNAPVAYQQRGAERVPVEARFELQAKAGGAQASFVVGDYDRSQPLVIDPILAYSTYMGGSGSEFGGYVAVDSMDNVFIAYMTSVSESLNASTDIHVTKFTPATNTIQYSTTIGGSGIDIVNAIAIGASGVDFAAYVTGYTNNPTFPHCINGISDCAPYGGIEDAFVTALAPNGSVWFSRFLGGSGNEAGAGIAVDTNRNVYVIGDTDEDFPTTPGSLYPTKVGGPGSHDSDAFVTKLDPMGNILYSTYLGGSGYDEGHVIALDALGNMVIGGTTYSTDFPLVAPAQTTPGHMWVARINAAGTTLDFSTYLGGSGGSNDVRAIAVVPVTQDIVVAGAAESLGFPQSVARLQASYGGGQRDAFVTRYDPTGFPVLFSSFLGGSGNDVANGLAIAPGGDIVVVGSTTSTDFPRVTALQSSLAGGSDAFMSRVHADALSFSTYLGGSGGDYGNSVAMGGSGCAYLGGRSTSGNYPVTVSALKASPTGASDLVLSKVCFNISSDQRMDFGGDLRDDIMWRNGFTGQNWLWNMNGTSIVSDGAITALPTEWQVSGIGDMSGDNKADVVWRNTATGQPWIWLMDGNNIIGNGPLPTLPGGCGSMLGCDWEIAAVADFNGDGRADILLRNHNTGENWVWFMDPTGLNIGSQGPLVTLSDVAWRIWRVGDMNGDGKADILWYNSLTGQSWVWIMDGTTIVNNGPLPVISDLNWQPAGLADMNGDGTADVMWRNSSTGQNWLWMMDPTGIAIGSQGPIPTLDLNWSVQNISDLNGDGKGDIVWRNTTTGQPWVWVMDGNNITANGPLPTLSDLNWQIVKNK